MAPPSSPPKTVPPAPLLRTARPTRKFPKVTTEPTQPVFPSSERRATVLVSEAPVQRPKDRRVKIREAIPRQTPAAPPEPLSSDDGNDPPLEVDTEAKNGRRSLSPNTDSTAAARDRAALVVLNGAQAGQVFQLKSVEVTLGRGREADVRIDDNGISRIHTRIVRSEGKFFVEDLSSTNGTFLRGREIERAELTSGDRVRLGPDIMLRFSLLDSTEEDLARSLYEASTKDPLTRAFNRKHLSERLAAEVGYANRHGTRVSVLMFDLDHFKYVNDTHGHPGGDVVLRVVAAQVQKTIRIEDLLARYGGEEFVILVRGIEPAKSALFAERVRSAVERLEIPWEGKIIRATISVGVASLEECTLGPTDKNLMRLADERLYRAKASGRNRVCDK